MQLHSILKLDQQKLAELTKSMAHENLTLTNRLMLVLMLIIMMRSTRTCPRKMTNQQLQEVVQLLGPSAELTGWRFGIAVTRWSRSTQLLYIEPG